MFSLFAESFAMSQRGSVGLILMSSIPSIMPLTSVELYMWMSITELGCTTCVVCGASVKTGTALSLLSVICIKAEATYKIMETACTFKSGQEVFSRKAFFFVRYLLWIYSALGNALAAWIMFSVLWKLFLIQAFEVLSHRYLVLFFVFIV